MATRIARSLPKLPHYNCLACCDLCAFHWERSENREKVMVIFITTDFDARTRRCRSGQSLKEKNKKERIRKHTLVAEFLDFKLFFLSKVCIGTPLKYLAHASSPRD